MSRIAFVPYGPSNSVNMLIADLSQSVRTVLKLRREGSRFRGRTGDLIINWGSGRDLDRALVGTATVLNSPEAINRASNKIAAFTAMRNAGNVSTVGWTVNREEAQAWLDAGEHVFCRTTLRGHSGEGIVCASTTVPDDLGNVDHLLELPTAPLYTKGVTNRHREYRVHIMKGEVLFVQQKRRASGYRENPNYSNVVRNHGNGWVYAHLGMTTPNQACIANAIAAVAAVGLDFGAVDVLTNGDDAWVLEINTAPGQSGDTNRSRYVQAFENIFNGADVLEGLESALAGARPEAEESQEPVPAPTTPPSRPVHVASSPTPVGRSLQQQIPAQEPVPANIAAASVAPATVVEEESTRTPTPTRSSRRQTTTATNSITPAHDSFYILSVNGGTDIGWYDGVMESFFLSKGVGMISLAEATVVRQVQL